MVRLLHLRVKIWLLQLNCHSVRNATAPSDQAQALANGHTAIIVNLFCPQYAADQGFVRSFKFDFKSIHISCDRPTVLSARHYSEAHFPTATD